MPLDQTLPEVTEVGELSLALFPLDFFFRDGRTSLLTKASRLKIREKEQVVSVETGAVGSRDRGSVG